MLGRWLPHCACIDATPEPASTYDSRNLPDLFFPIAATVVAYGFLSPALLAQGPTTDPPPDPRINAPSASVEIAKPVPAPTPSAAGERRFWDKENVALCTASAALSAADFAVTRANPKWRPGIELRGASVGQIHVGVGRKLYRGKRGRNQPKLFLSQDPPSPAGENRLAVNIGTSAGAVSYRLASGK
jgi:hypothetical protein